MVEQTIGATETNGTQCGSSRCSARCPAAGRWAGHLAAAAAFAALAVAMTWPLAAHLRHHLVSWGDPVFQAWTMAWDVHALRTDPRHIFDANIFYP
ncbi:MAG: hypothetical protein IRY97_11990, partial [Thermomicrobiaceae bacterium]|nr:hypothetical protein [Thermomicrobiaceae bacterium]